MLRSQRILVVVGLLLFAWLLHVNFCEWALTESPTNMARNANPSASAYTPILAWDTEGAPVLRQGAMRPSYIGLFTQGYVSRKDSVLWGMIVPLLLMMLLTYLALGWRRDSRVARGLCAGCGYDLRGLKEPTAKCPECGTPIAAAKASPTGRTPSR